MIAKNMVANLQTKPTYNSPVTAIRALRRMHMEVDIKTTRGHRKRTYAGVFNTTTLGCLKRMDLRHAGLNYATKQAIRSLGYGPAAKVGIKFKRAWWIHDLGKYSVKMGGLGHSDLTIRTCVYPSYNIYDGEDKTAVLLCSYTWQQDSERISSLMSTNADHEQKVCDEAELRELLIRELVRLHKNDDMSPAELYNLINDNYIDHHAFDWYKDPNAVGAFAFFRPQQFSNMWNKMIQPSGDLVLVGEACSPHHAWVVGALESVVHGIHAWLALNRGAVPEMEDAMRILEKPIDGIPFVGLPLYMDPNISRWHGVLGMDTRDKHLNGMGSEGPSMSDVLAQLPSNYNQ
jgi:monoamine oxidase